LRARLRNTGKSLPKFGRHLLVALAALAPATLLACQGCRSTSGTGQGGTTTINDHDAQSAPTLRFYVLTDIAGALEPCGCVRDQLGGLDHLSAFIASERKNAPASAVISAGPVFFLDPALTPEKSAQDVTKAETLASALGESGLVAFAPGRNDWAADAGTLEKLRTASRASIVASNLEGTNAAWRGPALREIGGVKVGFIGASALGQAELGAPEGVTAKEVIPAMRAQVDELKKGGAQILVALAATGRGEAKRIADALPELTVVVVGSASARGDGNTEAPPPERLGNVIVAEAGNHLTTALVIDFFVRNGSFQFADGSGLEEGRKRAALLRRIDELRGRIAQWEKQPNIKKEDLQARRDESKKLEAELAALESRPPPAKGSFFRANVVEVRESLGSDKDVQAKLAAYYKQVNEANRIAFADRKPRPAAAGQPSFAGIDACDSCHLEPREVWDKTRHAHAYETLTKQHKEFNLDCVSCHVTGYDLPGGSTVTHVEELQDVQCEVCHGPGSLHVKNSKVAMPIPKPKPEQCLACHHPPHVHEFDAQARMVEVLGPGHGLKKDPKKIAP
jgi:hypothetical protein